jgi:hypothetical protein
MISLYRAVCDNVAAKFIQSVLRLTYVYSNAAKTIQGDTSDIPITFNPQKKQRGIPIVDYPLTPARSRACLGDILETDQVGADQRVSAPIPPALDWRSPDHATGANGGAHDTAPGETPGTCAQPADKQPHDTSPDKTPAMSPAEQAKQMLAAMQETDVLPAGKTTAKKRPAAAVGNTGRGGKNTSKQSCSSGNIKKGKKGCTRCRGYSCAQCADPNFKGQRYTRSEWLKRFGS